MVSPKFLLSKLVDREINCGNAIAEIWKKRFVSIVAMSLPKQGKKKFVTIVAMALPKMGGKKCGSEIWGE